MRLMFSGWLLMAVLVSCLTSVDAQQVSAPSDETLPAGVRLGAPLTFNHWVCPKQTGVLVGRVVLPSGRNQMTGVSNAMISLRGQNGEVVHAQANRMGEFVIENVDAGIYSMTAKADDAYACSVMHVLDAGKVDGASFPSRVELAAANVDMAVLKSALIRYVSPMQNQSFPVLPVAGFRDLAQRVVNNQYSRVQRVDGGLTGTVLAAGTWKNELVPAGMMNVFIVRNKEVIARSLTDNQGLFRIENLPAGNYGIMAVGGAGVGFAGFELVEGGFATNLPAKSPRLDGASNVGDQEHLVGLAGSLLQAPSSMLTMQVAPSSEVIDFGIDDDDDGILLLDEGIVAPVPPGFGDPFGPVGLGGGGGSFGGGGGGGGFGGGGLGGLAGLAGIAGIIAATSDDDDNNNRPIVVPPPASPSSF